MAGGLTREVLGSPTFDSGLRGSNKLWQGSMWLLTTLFCGSGSWSRKRLKFSSHFCGGAQLQVLGGSPSLKPAPEPAPEKKPCRLTFT